MMVSGYFDVSCCYSQLLMQERPVSDAALSASASLPKSLLKLQLQQEEERTNAAIAAAFIGSNIPGL